MYVYVAISAQSGTRLAARMAQLGRENDPENDPENQEIQIPSSADLPEPGGQLSYEGLCLVRCFRCEAP